MLISRMVNHSSFNNANNIFIGGFNKTIPLGRVVGCIFDLNYFL